MRDAITAWCEQSPASRPTRAPSAATWSPPQVAWLLDGVVEHADGHSPVTGLALVLGQATKIVRSLAHSRDRPSVTKFKGKSKGRRVVHFQQRNSPQPLNLQRTGLRSSTAVSLECVGRPQRVRPVVSQL